MATTLTPADQIVKAYRRIAPKGTVTGVKMATMRESVKLTARQFNEAIIELAGRQGVHLREQADQKTITPLDTIHAVTLAGRARHLLLIER